MNDTQQRNALVLWPSSMLFFYSQMPRHIRLRPPIIFFLKHRYIKLVYADVERARRPTHPDTEPRPKMKSNALCG
jgi:hypothetical protein